MDSISVSLMSTPLMSTVIRFAMSTAMDASMRDMLRELAEIAQEDTHFQQELDLVLASGDTASQAGELRDCVETWCAGVLDCEGSAAEFFADAVVAAARVENSSLGSENAQRLRNQTSLPDIAVFRKRWGQQATAANPKLALTRTATVPGTGRPPRASHEVEALEVAAAPANVTADPTALDSAQLVRRASEGDRRAWERLVDKYARLIWAITRDFKLEDSDAADVAQATWLRLLEHIDRIEDPARVGSWIAATARNECLRSLAARKRVVLAHDEVTLEGQAVAGPEDDDEEENDLLAAERAEIVREAVSQLPHRWQQLMELLMADPPVSYAEIADRLDLPVGSIGPTRRRCLARLQTLLAPIGASNLY